MAELAHLNLAYAQRHSDLIQALHIAAQPLLILKGFDDQADPVGLSVNNALLLPPEGDAKYVEPASSAFDAQRAELEALASAIKSLGLAVLREEKNGVESGKAKALDRLDSNSMLAVLSKDLEQTLQEAFNLAGQYMGMEPPTVVIDRDFDVEPLDGSMLTAINTLYQGGLLDQETALRILERGELFDDSIDVEEILAASELEQQAGIEQSMAIAQGQGPGFSGDAQDQLPNG
jgi:hypothetical protein